MTYAGFWLRLVAYLIDWVIVEVVVWAATFVVAAGGSDEETMNLVAGGIGLLLGLLYWAILESSPRQATLGKMAVGLKVTDLQGNRISFARAIGRTLAKLLSTLIFMIGWLMAGWTEKKQGLHDKIAGTLVVKKGA
jgi:uncharacterized RDD family membrane protein YckC